MPMKTTGVEVQPVLSLQEYSLAVGSKFLSLHPGWLILITVLYNRLKYFVHAHLTPFMASNPQVSWASLKPCNSS